MITVTALPKATAIKNKEAIIDSKTPIISILNIGDPVLFDKYDKALTLWFDDTTPSKQDRIVLLAGDDRKLLAMQLNQAEEIIKFVENEINAKAKQILVHCSMGICRSGAVAMFIYNTYLASMGIPFSIFRADNPTISPNLWVEELLYYAYNSRSK